MLRHRWLISFRFALRAQSRHPVRAALALLGIIVGVAAVIVMVSMSRGTQKRVLDQIAAMGLNRLTISAGEIRQGQTRTRATTLSLQDARAIALSCLDAGLIAPLQTRRLPIKYGALNKVSVVVGATPELFRLRTLDLSCGRFFGEDEQNGASRVVVLGYSVATILFQTNDSRVALQELIRINGVAFRVIGVLSRRGVNPDATNDDEVVFIPLKTAMRRVFNVDYLSQIFVELRDRSKMESLRFALTDELRSRHNIRGTQKDDFEIQNSLDLIRTEQEAQKQLSYLIGVIGAVSLLVGAVGILAVMLLSLKDRIREVGVRRALGAKRRNILAQFVIEAMSLSFAGGLLGVLVGLLGAYGASLFGEWPFTVEWDLVGLAFGSSSVIGVLFGVYPAVRAARLDPIIALQAE